MLTRQLVFRLWSELRVPVLALTDADPYGLHIAAIYKFGSLVGWVVAGRRASLFALLLSERYF